MNESEVNEAIDTVARHVVWAVTDNAVGEEWENYPEIGEHDWERVEQRVEQICGSLCPSSEAFATAYAFLEGRAEHE